MADQSFTIGELARRTGVAPSALRYYEELGLMPPAGRISGKRRYDQAAARGVGMILFLRDVGFSLAEIKSLLTSRSSGGWRELAGQKVAELDEHIFRAHVARVALQHALACSHEDLLDCPNFAAALDAKLAGKPLEEAHLR